MTTLNTTSKSPDPTCKFSPITRSYDRVRYIEVYNSKLITYRASRSNDVDDYRTQYRHYLRLPANVPNAPPTHVP